MHHINLLVKDLGTAMAQYRSVLGPVEFVEEALPGRGVRTARFRVGETWIVLVQPIAPGEPADVLASRGEGLFLLSLTVDDLDGARRELLARDPAAVVGPVREGLANWRVADIAPAAVSGARLQLCESAQPTLGTGAD